jgi:hypothetical protein
VANNRTWYVVRLKDRVTLSSTKEEVEAARMCAFFNEVGPLAAVSDKAGRVAPPPPEAPKQKRRSKARKAA